LRVVEIKLPSLRERRIDMPLLVRPSSAGLPRRTKPVKEIKPDAMDALLNYAWPGNVRELEAAIESAVVLCRGDKITLRDLPANIREREQAGTGGEASGLFLPAETVKDAEKQLIVRALKETDGNRTRAAKRIGMSRRTLHRKLHEYGLEQL
jgi:two-component system response regulator HydG